MILPTTFNKLISKHQLQGYRTQLVPAAHSQEIKQHPREKLSSELKAEIVLFGALLSDYLQASIYILDYFLH